MTRIKRSIVQSPPMPAPLVEARAVVKTFGPTRALDGVSVAFLPGEVHGIIGENGAGKSTLMKILGGIEPPTAGHVLVGGEPVRLASVADAERRGVVMIHQELNLVDELSIADNVFLGRETRRLGMVNGRAARAATRELLARLRTPLDPRTRVGTLSIAQKQMVEIAKALSRRAALLIMDEPTAVLTRHETAALFAVIDQLRRDGVAVVYISHLLPEVLQLCDRVTVLRDGRNVAALSPAEMKTATQQQLASLMVGRPMEQHFPARAASSAVSAVSAVSSAPFVLDVTDVTVAGVVESASFAVRAGEILGFAGLIGAGRTELAEAIAGLRARRDGVIRMNGEAVRIDSPQDAIRAGIAYVSEDRKGTGLATGMSIVHNTTMVSLAKYTRGFINRRAEIAATRARASQLQLKAGSLGDPVSSLSGGNQQKVALAKWLETEPKLLIVDEPTRGVDVGAKEEIYRQIRTLTQAGMACVLISSELNEVIGLSDRIAIMRQGRIAAIVDANTATEEQVMRHAAI